MKKRPICYCSTRTGIANQSNGSEVVYRGRIYRLSKEDIGTEKQDQLNTEMFKHLEGLPDFEDGLEVTSPVECYEIFDDETGDILYMLRIPYRTVRSN